MGAPTSETASAAKIGFHRAEPQLFVTDLARSLSFFVEKLGFEIQFVYGEPPFYAQVARDAAHLNLRVVPGPLVEPALVRRKSYVAASVCVDSIKQLFLEFQAKGVDFHQALRAEPWGAQTFVLIDPDGNLILFAQ